MIGILGATLFCVVIAVILLPSAGYKTNNTILGFQFNLYYWMFAVSLVVVLAFQPPDRSGPSTQAKSKASSHSNSIEGTSVAMTTV
jgi:hypothetical protein